MGEDNTASVEDQAVHWFVALRDEEATEADWRAFDRWLKADAAHTGAWRSLERMWGGLDAVAARAGRRRPRRLKRAAAAALVLAGLVVLGWAMAPEGLFADHRTATGELRTVTLADGSRVELGAASALDVAFSARERRVILRTGRAFFTVVPDAARPFVVAARAGEVRVLGTAFDVNLDDGVTVAVARNAVQVSVAAGPAARVAQGQGVRYDARGLSAVAPADIDSVQAWRQGQLVFRDAALGTVVAALQRYHSGRIALVGGGLGQRRVTAVFDAHDADAALDAIARSLSLRIYRAGRFLTVIVPGGG